MTCIRLLLHVLTLFLILHTSYNSPSVIPHLFHSPPPPPVSLLSTMYMLQQAEELQGGRGGGRGKGSRPGTRESGLHQLYLDVISLSPLRKRSRDNKSSSPSGDKSTRQKTYSPRCDREFSPIGSDNTNFGELDSTTLEDDSTDLDFTPTDLHYIRSLALCPDVIGLLLSSFCTIIFGHDLVKMGLLLGLFGGSSAESCHGSGTDATSRGESFRTRSDIHVLIVGDPGLGKSQMLRAAATAAPRSVLVCGNTSSTAGLTVSMVREPGGGGDMCLEAGRDACIVCSCAYMRAW